MEHIMETLLGLVSHYSPSGQEGPAVAWLVRRMAALGYREAFVDAAGNAIGVIGEGPKQVIFLGHIDTVPGEIPVRMEDGRLYARGAVDAKGPLACFVDAVAQVGPLADWQFVVIGAVEEERNSDGARFVAAQYRPNYLVVGEPNRWDRIALGYKGSAWANITVRRAQAHSAGGAQSACEAAVEAWLSVRAYAERFNAGKPRAFEMALPTLRGMASGADGFEQWARLEIGCRLPCKLSPEDWYTALAEAAPGADVERVGLPIPAWSCEKNSRLVRALLSGIRAQGGAPAFVYKTGTADLNIVAPVWNCPALVYGPGDSTLDHTPNEHIAVDEYGRAVAALKGALIDLIGRSVA